MICSRYKVRVSRLEMIPTQTTPTHIYASIIVHTTNILIVLSDIDLVLVGKLKQTIFCIFSMPVNFATPQQNAQHGEQSIR